MNKNLELGLKEEMRYTLPQTIFCKNCRYASQSADILRLCKFWSSFGRNLGDFEVNPDAYCKYFETKDK